MALFPATPTLDDVFTIDTKTWVYNGYGWELQSAGGDVANGAYNQANAATNIATYAANHANSAYNAANVSIDVFARETANGAYAKANQAFNQANTTIDIAIAANNLSLSTNTVAYTALSIATNANTYAQNANTYAREAASRANSNFMIIAVTDEYSVLTANTNRARMRAPFPLYLTSTPRASLNIASSSGAVTADIKVNGSTIFSTPLTIDAGSTTSVGAATPAVLSTTTIGDDAELTFDVTGAGTNAVGLKVAIYYRKP